MMGPQAVLISNPNSKHGELVNTIKTRIQGYLDSIKYQLINYNVPRAQLAAAVSAPPHTRRSAPSIICTPRAHLGYFPRQSAITPGKKSPTILPLEDPEWVAVSSMVLKADVPQARISAMITAMISAIFSADYRSHLGTGDRPALCDRRHRDPRLYHQQLSRLRRRRRPAAPLPPARCD